MVIFVSIFQCPIFCVPQIMCNATFVSSDTAAFPQRVRMFFVAICNAICERVAVTNKAITFRFTRDRRSLTLVFSVRCSWVVFWWEAGDCDPQVSRYERLDLYSDTDCQCLRCHAGIHVFQRESGEWNEMKTAGRGEESPEVVVTELLRGWNFGGPTWDFLHSISAV